MNISEPFIRRPVATTLLTVGVLLAGLFAFLKLPVAPLPQVDFPVILVQAQMPGASPETMAVTVAAPLERRLGSIADVNEMSSTSSTGTVRIVLLFGLSRDIDGAARDVQAAINAARADLPTALRQNPTYRKFNPADSPIVILGMTSDTLTPGQLYDAGATVVQQKLSQLPGVGNVDIGGSSLPAVRVELDPTALFHYGIGLEGIRAGLASANANSPKGAIEAGDRRFQLYANDQGRKAEDYRDLVVAYRNGAAVKLTDVGEVIDSVEDRRNLGVVNGKQGVLLFVYKQPGSNVVDTINGVKAALPQIVSALPGGIDVKLTGDRSATIRASLAATEETLLIAVGLVILVVFAFLRSGRATLIPAVAVPISIVGTFSVMYLLGYSLNILSLMALIIGTGFVVDDAIVVLENVQRHIEMGKSRIEAALVGAREVGFTVISMSLSLIAVFLPILLMGGLIGRIFQEFAVTLSLAILISLVLSLTTTPMMCARFLRPEAHGAGRRPNILIRGLEGAFTGTLNAYERTLRVALGHPRLVLLVLAATVGLNVYLYVIVPKGFFPEQDTGQMMGGIQADQRISFQSMEKKLKEAAAIVQADPAVDSVVGFTGGRGTNSANVFVGLKPVGERASIGEVSNRLRPKLSQVAGARLYVFPRQDLQMGGRQSFAQYQYTLQGDTAAELYAAAPKLVQALQKDPTFADVTSDQQEGGLESRLVIDRATAFRYGITPDKIDNTLYDAFGQRQVSTIYNPLNQYHVVMEIAPRYLENPETLKQLYVSTSGGKARGSATTNAVAGTVAAAPAGAVPSTTAAADASTNAAAVASDSARNAAANAIAASKGSASSSAPVSSAVETMVPLSAFTRVETGNAPVQVSHQGLFVATTISFNLSPGKSLSDATVAIDKAMAELRLPATIHGEYAGAAKNYVASASRQPLLILAAILAVYAILGILYESFVHPVTILSTLPSAGIGALLALLVTGTEFTIVALIAVFLLIGIVKKNAIMMIDFALDAERTRGASPRDAIFEACLLRFRPIMMTTLAALLGAAPLIFGGGEGSELRRPLGIAIAGGLIVSQILTLYTTPVVYLCLDRLRHRVNARRRGGAAALPAGE
ncbi:efflux RND transporter permease subunit [Methylobacterium sp. E-041]|jgi:multidrug efflux pump|uniref:efflux RND transporter permease subunit n=1 Tax=unclassified Methylobacterium TaxID=2615210 RepID=UPI0011C8A291|nr:MULTISPECIES: efflux RND transporter permease subunit [unclassified Methylobacterium]MCJ2006433.1 efflux RND transporter permease subunit [Methylobacterium sp. J-092]MCJ2103890.1 efflux RND transporter permease subunit [Methylobacterium sp. E-041]MCJ2112595.1 efflux RND transporter permease subunit [Methylobacterium sp. E-025]TXN46434.1 nodulation protein [Methylobacterium sp. WL119]TXN64253.1 nodulation protein [Methylobacterium sp. WL30]